jgi:DNA-binding MarR family transcriptional regulator
MTFKELGQKPLITNGTLPGVVDRLEDKGLVRRVVQVDDRRSVLARLTPRGEEVFEQAFTAHILYLKARFDQLDAAGRDEICGALRKLRSVLVVQPQSKEICHV